MDGQTDGRTTKMFEDLFLRMAGQKNKIDGLFLRIARPENNFWRTWSSPREWMARKTYVKIFSCEWLVRETFLKVFSCDGWVRKPFLKVFSLLRSQSARKIVQELFPSTVVTRLKTNS